jgi:hypothetical protein
MDKKGTLKRKNITLETKLEIIKRFDNGETKTKIGEDLGFPESTIRTILKKSSEYQEKGKIASTSSSVQCTRNRTRIMIEMEDLLIIWLEDCNQKRIPIDGNNIKIKALSLFSSLKKEKYQEDSSTFLASKGWLENFKSRSGVKNIKLTGEAASADKDAAAKYPDELRKIIDENGYDLRQIFNVDETGLYWKKMPSRTFLAKKEAAAPGHKASKDRITILLGGNAEGDCKLKPLVVYRTMNPRAFKGLNKQSLPVIWKSNKKAWMTRQLFEEWFTSYFCPTAEKYCKENNLDFKVLLILDNAPGHPPSLNELNTNVKVIYLPANTTSLLQPMDQGTISTFKAYYLRRTFKKAIEDTTGDNPITLEEFWKKYDIKQAVENIHKSWNKVTESCMRAVWQNLLPECANNFRGFNDRVNEVIEEIATVGQELGLEADSENIRELLESHSKDLTDDDLLAIDHEHAYEEDEKETEEKETAPKEISSKKLAELLTAIEKTKEIIREVDPNEERSMNVCRGLDRQVNCYRTIMQERKKSTVQLKLDSFFSKK